MDAVESAKFQKPNLQPPITTVAQALDYQKQLQAIEPNVTYLMSLYVRESCGTSTAYP